VKILVVEDDRSIAASLIEGLTAEGYSIEHAATGVAALAAADYDMVLLDLGLPDMDGRDLFRQLRTRGATPIIMLTARAEEFDRVLGLELGADDYITKPFSFRELVARVRAVSRRTLGSSADPAINAIATTPEVQTIFSLTVDRRTRRVHVGEEEISLTAKEFDLLAYLALDAGAVSTRTEILENVWDAHWYGPTKTVDAHVASLRKKLGHPEWIQAVRGVGFRLELTA